jgi:predicted NAD-dependent protein-ADP-ribosyltransferase YbiA (DUF1768 family)
MNAPILYNDTKYQPLKNTQGLYDYVIHDEKRIWGFFGPYFFLSNGYKLPIHDLSVKSITYLYSENAYQASKFEDLGIRKLFGSIHFTEAIQLAYDLKASIRPNWQLIKLDVMENILIQKFSNPILKSRLLDTATRELREDNHWQCHYWGFCNGYGYNHLGKILMKIRN